MQRFSIPSFCLLVCITLGSCKQVQVENGITLTLAKERKANISDLSYSLHFTIPQSKSDSIKGLVEVSFSLEYKSPIVLDFRGDKSQVINVLSRGKAIEYRHENGHVIIDKKHSSQGANSLSIEFISDNGSLNRSDEFMYTLLVPDRASTVFPCFDQPDLRAKFSLTLDIPEEWIATSNGEIERVEQLSESMARYSFKSTNPISTYLFAFTAGKFKVDNKTVNNRSFSLYHRETDEDKLKRNLQDIYELHSQSLQWLEEYTGIEYPFGKLDIILLPGFQYSGMEHPGAIFYRDSRLLLDENPSVNQRLRKANLIAHEVAHQWFGNLVTMSWFNDVWLKEVFAGFMADLIVNPQYPEINHQLGFLLSHFPGSYSVDRTAGANPIVQDLDNMTQAGTLYGDIIYHKAPIMMQQLELFMGKDAFKNGVREYLSSYYMSNATWDQLLAILNLHSKEDITAWADVWTKTAGRPSVAYAYDSESNCIHLKSINSAPVPQMWVEVDNAKSSGNLSRFWMSKLPVSLPITGSNKQDEPYIVNSSGIAYGSFEPDSIALKWILSNLNAIPAPVTRASVHISLWEMFLDRRVGTEKYFKFVLISLEKEQDPQIQSYILSTLETLFWRFSSEEIREYMAPRIEDVLWKIVQGRLPVNQRKTTLSTLFSVFSTNESFSKLYTAWDKEDCMGIKLNEDDRTRLAYELMIRKPELYHTIALGEVERINNPDRVAKFDFILDAVSPNPSQRVAFFESLGKVENRKPEPWVVEALRWLHHPLRSNFSIRFIEPSLNMLEEVQRTGDIFFPKMWLDATLWGHSSPDAAQTVSNWIEANPQVSNNLRMKLLQSSDMLYRATGISVNQ